VRARPRTLPRDVHYVSFAVAVALPTTGYWTPTRGVLLCFGDYKLRSSSCCHEHIRVRIFAEPAACA